MEKCVVILRWVWLHGIFFQNNSPYKLSSTGKLEESKQSYNLCNGFMEFEAGRIHKITKPDGACIKVS